MVEKIPNPRLNANIFSCCTFAWFLPTIVKGYKKVLTEDDLFEILDDQQSTRLGGLLEDAWEKEKERLDGDPSLWRAIWNIFGCNFMSYALISIATELIFKMGQCWSFIVLLKYYSQETQTITIECAYFCAFMLTLCSFAVIVGQHQCMYNYRLLGMKVRVACCSLIYRKSLKLRKDAIGGGSSVGHIVNLITNDVNRFDFIVPLLNNLWLCPVQILIVMIILYCVTGWTGIIGVIIFILIIPIQMIIGRKLSVLRKQTAEITDDRIKIMTEIISGIETIKMLAWEKPFTTLVKRTRRAEIKKLRHTALFLASLMGFTNFLPKLGLFASILTYASMEFVLTPTYVFGLVVFYNLLKLPLNKFFSQALFRLEEAKVTVERIREFLQTDEVQRRQDESKMESRLVGIELKNVCANWNGSKEESILKNVSLDISKFKLVAITGSVGSGKSSLLNLILRELSLSDGLIDVKGAVSYSSQEPWLFGATIKENILFNQTYNELQYRSTIRVCALEKDLSALPNGDKTIVAENGSNLSGGQKARINLARAIYRTADIYLLDDPLSSVDANVAEFIFHECISKFLEDKCVLIGLNQLHFLKYVDYVYVLQNGTIVSKGTYKNLQEGRLNFFNDNKSKMRLRRTASITYDPDVKEEEIDIKETRDVGTVDFKVYGTYLKAGGRIHMHVFILVIATLFVASCVMFDAGIGYWSNIDDQIINKTSVQPFLSRQEFITILSSVMFIIIITAITSAVAYYLLFIICSENLHNNIFDNLIAAPMRFFHSNPSGRILNRFSKDLGLMDDYLHTVLIDTILMTLTVAGVFVMKAVINYWLCVVMVFLVVLFCGIRKLYLPAIVAIKRLEGVTKSPLCTHLKTSLEGLVTIRAFKEEPNCKKTFDDLQDVHTSSWFMYLSSVFAYRFLIDTLGVILVGVVTFSFFLMEDSYASTAGLAITQSMMLLSMAQWCVRQSCEVSVTMTAVERITEYLSLETEDCDKKREVTIRPTWPEHGNIEFSDVNLRYGPVENPVLKRVSFKVKSKQKVGIVGRTGAGKSSLCAALFQLAHTDGSITIDGVDIKQVPLDNLRSKLSVIPQIPLLFSGTIRNNLDPFGQTPDAELWNALYEVDLKEFVTNMPDGLSTKIIGNGANFSVGQRQLLCLARAIIRKNKILIVDEATANVDPKTDAKIQSTIRRRFHECTVLVIAHRLHTIIDSDLVLVLHDGQVEEYGDPCSLLRKRGRFFEMVERTGQISSGTPNQIAKNVNKNTI